MITESEIERKRIRLVRRGKRSTIAFTIYVVLMIISVLLKLTLKLSDWQLMPFAIVMFPLLGYSVYIQLTMRCPYCNFYLGLSTRIGTPSICPKCKRRIKKSFW